MLTKAQVSYIKSLSRQKERVAAGAFLVEGDKIAREWLESPVKIAQVLALPRWLEEHAAVIARHPEARVLSVSEAELERITALQTPNKVLLTVPVPEPEQRPVPPAGWCLALDDIRDPGNLGTLIRIADWFGIGTLYLSPGCADVYNPKVVQSAMGGHLRVQLIEGDLAALLRASGLPVWAATLGGEDVYRIPAPAPPGILLIGNESRGVSPELLALADRQVTIPRSGGAESLNAAVSAGILCALLLRR